MKIAAALVALFLLLGVIDPARAAVQSRTVKYQHGGMTFHGYVAWDDAQAGKRPGVLVFPEWWGLNEYAKKRAEQLAALGYVAVAADPYGEGKVTNNPKESGAWAGGLRKDVKEWHGRATAAMKALTDMDNVDASKIAAIGFGGSTCLMLANHGEPLKAVVSFHGALPVPTDEEAKAVKAKILICHGADDSFIPEETIKKVKETYDRNKTDYKFIAYPGAQHSFTVAGADDRGLKGIRYNEPADRQSWAEMGKLFGEVLGK